MHRFYVHPKDLTGKEINIGPDEAKHAFCVLRLKKNDQIIAFDGKGKEYICIIKFLSARKGIAQIKEIIQHNQEFVRITLAAAIPKQSKFEAIVDKATQLGVFNIIPLLTKRTIVKITKDKAETKVKRWQEIAVQAAKQCACVYVPRITPITDFETVLKNTADFRLRLIPCLSKNTLSIKTVLRKEEPTNAVVFIGPEGDFDEQEIAMARKAGIIGVTLGENVLRCETAAITVLSIINYEWGL